ncbi:MAG: GH3 auxin-responsive promoter family protein [Clostridia bacterium]|nr:GH3 auxin-responsive promoter family protein [Clostridia bacterium]
MKFILDIIKNAVTAVMNLIINRVMVFRGRKSVHELDGKSKDAVNISEKLLFRLLDENKDTVYGKKYGFADIHSIEEYKEKVPFSDYDTYEPYIKQMTEENAENLITVRKPYHYALSSGSVGVPKHIPVSEEELTKYRKFGTNMCFGVADEYYRNTTGRSFRNGFGFNLIELKFGETKSGIPKGAISGTILKPLKDLIQYFVVPSWDVISPQKDMDLKYLRARYALSRRNLTFIDGAFMTAVVDIMDYVCANWEMLCEDIAQGTINPKIEIPDDLRSKFEKSFAPDPERAEELVREFQKGFDRIVPRIWPDIQFVASIGTGGFFTYTKRMRHYTGRNIPFNNLTYAASEGLFATARHMGDTSYVLIPDGGFYEFIPVKSEDETKTLTIDQLEEGEEYEIVVTNLSGFYRYRIKDVIRVTGFYNEAPMIEFIYRKSQLLSIEGEKTNEEAVRWTIEQTMKVTGIRVNDYSVYADTDTEPGHYTFIIEPDKIIPIGEREHIRDVLEEKLMQANPSFGDKIRRGILGKTELVTVQQQTYQLYRDYMITKGVSPNQLKPVRVIDTPIKHNFFFSLKEVKDGQAGE